MLISSEKKETRVPKLVSGGADGGVGGSVTGGESAGVVVEVEVEWFRCARIVEA